MDRKAVIEELAPGGVLRAGINMSNFLLVTGRGEAGEPQGVSPDMAAAIADDLGLKLELVPFDGPGDVADAAATDGWDIANIAAEAERAKTITFSSAYCEIQATYLTPPDSVITRFADVDQPGVRICVKERSAYDLWLTANLQHASLVRVGTIDESFTTFRDEKLDVLAGLRPALLKQQRELSGSRIFDDSFTAVQQSIGCKKGLPLAARYLQDFVHNSLSGGLVESLIERHGVVGKLSAAPMPASSNSNE